MIGRFNQINDESSSTGQKLLDFFEERGIEYQNENGQLDFYKMAESMASIWGSLSQDEQSLFSQYIAGSRQASNWANFMQNWEGVEGATKTSRNSEGSAAKSNEQKMNSIEGRTAQLQASISSFATDTISSGAVKGVVSALNAVVKFFDAIPGSSQIAGITAVTAAVGALTSLIPAIGKFYGAGALGGIARLLSTATSGGSTISKLLSKAVTTTEGTINTANTATNGSRVVIDQALAESAGEATAALYALTEAATAATASENAETAANEGAAASEAQETAANEAATVSETQETVANEAAAVSETEETVANQAATASETAETVSNVTSGASEKKSGLLAVGGSAAKALLSFLAPALPLILGSAAVIAVIGGLVSADQAIEKSREEKRQEKITENTENLNAVKGRQNKIYSDIAKQMQEDNKEAFEKVFGENSKLLSSDHQYTDSEVGKLKEYYNDRYTSNEGSGTATQNKANKELNRLFKIASMYQTGINLTQARLQTYQRESLNYQEHYGFGRDADLTDTSKIDKYIGLDDYLDTPLQQYQNEMDRANNVLLNMEKYGLQNTDEYSQAQDAFTQAETKYNNATQPVLDFLDSHYSDYQEIKSNLESMDITSYEDQIAYLNKIGDRKTAKNFERVYKALEATTGLTGDEAEQSYEALQILESDTEEATSTDEITVADIISSNHGILQQIGSVASAYENFNTGLLNNEDYGNAAKMFKDWDLSDIETFESMFPDIEDEKMGEYMSAITGASSPTEMAQIYSNMLSDELKGEFGAEGLAGMEGNEEWLAKRFEALGLESSVALQEAKDLVADAKQELQEEETKQAETEAKLKQENPELYRDTKFTGAATNVAAGDIETASDLLVEAAKSNRTTTASGVEVESKLLDLGEVMTNFSENGVSKQDMIDTAVAAAEKGVYFEYQDENGKTQYTNDAAVITAQIEQNYTSQTQEAIDLLASIDGHVANLDPESGGGTPESDNPPDDGTPEDSDDTSEGTPTNITDDEIVSGQQGGTESSYDEGSVELPGSEGQTIYGQDAKPGGIIPDLIQSGVNFIKSKDGALGQTPEGTTTDDNSLGAQPQEDNAAAEPTLWDKFVGGIKSAGEFLSNVDWGILPEASAGETSDLHNWDETVDNSLHGQIARDKAHGVESTKVEAELDTKSLNKEKLEMPVEAKIQAEDIPEQTMDVKANVKADTKDIDKDLEGGEVTYKAKVEKPKAEKNIEGGEITYNAKVNTDSIKDGLKGINGKNALASPIQISADTSEADAKVAEVQGRVDALNGTTASPHISARDSATGVINGVQTALNNLDGDSATVTINIVKNGSTDVEMAKGGTIKKSMKYNGERHAKGGKAGTVGTWLGDEYNGHGEKKPELVVTPDGHAHIAGLNGWEYEQLPVGTQIYSNTDTKKLLGERHAMGGVLHSYTQKTDKDEWQYGDFTLPVYGGGGGNKDSGGNNDSSSGNGSNNSSGGNSSSASTSTAAVQIEGYIEDIADSLEEVCKQFDTMISVVDDSIELEEYEEEKTDKPSEKHFTLLENKLDILNKYQAKLEEMGATIENSTDYRDVLKQIAELEQEQVELQAESLQHDIDRLDTDIAWVDEMYHNNPADAADRKIELYNQQLELIQKKMDTYLSNGYEWGSDEVQDLIEEQIDINEEIRDAIAEQTQEMADGFESVTDTNDDVDDYALWLADKEKEAIQKQVDLYQQQYDDETELLEKQDNQIDRQQRIQDAEADLTEAENKRVLVMGENGWEWDSNPKEVEDAKKALEDTKRDIAREERDEERSEELKDKIAEEWSKYYGEGSEGKEAYATQDSIYQKEQDIEDRQEELEKIDQKIAYDQQYYGQSLLDVLTDLASDETATSRKMDELNRIASSILNDAFGDMGIDFTEAIDNNGNVNIERAVELIYKKVGEGYTLSQEQEEQLMALMQYRAEKQDAQGETAQRDVYALLDSASKIGKTEQAQEQYQKEMPAMYTQLEKLLEDNFADIDFANAKRANGEYDITQVMKDITDAQESGVELTDEQNEALEEIGELYKKKVDLQNSIIKAGNEDLVIGQDTTNKYLKQISESTSASAKSTEATAENTKSVVKSSNSTSSSVSEFLKENPNGTMADYYAWKNSSSSSSSSGSGVVIPTYTDASGNSVAAAGYGTYMANGGTGTIDDYNQLVASGYFDTNGISTGKGSSSSSDSHDTNVSINSVSVSSTSAKDFISSIKTLADSNASASAKAKAAVTAANYSKSKSKSK